MIHRRSRSSSFYLKDRGSNENLLKLSNSKKSMTKRWWRLNKRFVILTLGVLLLLYIERQQELSGVRMRQLQAEEELFSWTECPASIEQAKGLYLKKKTNSNSTITDDDDSFAKNVVLLTASNLGYFPMLQTWESYATSSHLKWAVLALDEWMTQHSSLYRSVETHSEFFLRRFQRYHSSGYWSLQCNIWRSILSIMDRCQVDIIFSDVDNVILQDPFSVESDFGQKLRSNRYDYLYQTHFPLNRPHQNECSSSPGRSRGESTGFFYLRRDGAMKEVMQEVLSQCRSTESFDFWNIMTRRGYSHCSNSNETTSTDHSNDEDLHVCCLSSSETKRNRRYNMEGNFEGYEHNLLDQIHKAEPEVRSWHLNMGHRKLMKILHAGLYQQMQSADPEEQQQNAAVESTAVVADPEVVEPNQLLQASADVVQQLQHQEEDHPPEKDTNDQQQSQEEVVKATNDNNEEKVVVEPDQLLEISAEVVQQKQEEAQEEQKEEILQEEVLRLANDSNQVILHTDAAELKELEVLKSMDENYKTKTSSDQTEDTGKNVLNSSKNVDDKMTTGSSQRTDAAVATPQKQEKVSQLRRKKKWLSSPQQKQEVSSSGNKTDEVVQQHQSLSDKDRDSKKAELLSREIAQEVNHVNSLESKAREKSVNSTTEGVTRTQTLRHPKETLATNHTSSTFIQKDDALQSTKKWRKKRTVTTVNNDASTTALSKTSVTKKTKRVLVKAAKAVAASDEAATATVLEDPKEGFAANEIAKE